VAFKVASFTTVAGAAPAFNRLPVSPSAEGTVGFDIALHTGKDNRESGVQFTHVNVKLYRTPKFVASKIDECDPKEQTIYIYHYES